MLRTIVKKISAFLRGGTSTFNETEMLLLKAILNALPEAEAEIFSQQILTVSLVQRPNPRRLVVAYYSNKNKVSQLPYLGYEYCLAKVSYKLNGKTKTTNVVLHDGRLMSLERNVPSKSEEIDSITSVALHPSGYKSVAEEIDLEEHGQNA